MEGADTREAVRAEMTPAQIHENWLVTSLKRLDASIPWKPGLPPQKRELHPPVVPDISVGMITGAERTLEQQGSSLSDAVSHLFSRTITNLQEGWESQIHQIGEVGARVMGRESLIPPTSPHLHDLAMRMQVSPEEVLKELTFMDPESVRQSMMQGVEMASLGVAAMGVVMLGMANAEQLQTLYYMAKQTAKEVAESKPVQAIKNRLSKKEEPEWGDWETEPTVKSIIGKP